MFTLPIGINDFAHANETYYVDKTLIIKDILDSYTGKSILITRPRRFGKTLTLSMIDYFFNINKDSKKLFSDKLIYKEANRYKEQINKYPVIHINMKDLSADSPSSLINQTIDLISKTYREFVYLLDDPNILEIEKKEFLDISNKKNNDIYFYTTAIKNLSLLLEKHHKEKVIILIDEYDTPLDISYQKNYYDDVVLFFKKLYSSSIKDNQSLYFSILNGVLEVAKESIFSDLNNLNVLSVLNKNLSEYFGFTMDEVKKLLLDFKFDIDIEEVKKWYGGYGIKNVELFNPWSVLNLINNEMFGQYWMNTGSNNTLLSLINQIPNSINTLNEVINNKNITFKINNSITYKDVQNDFPTLLSYLIQTGYLQAKQVDMYGNYYVTLPNEELVYTFEREIISRGINTNQYNVALALKSAILGSKIDEISSILKEYVLNSFSYYDLKTEKEYQTMFVGILAVLFGDYIVKSEVNTSNGRCDIMLLPKNNKNIGLIIELKKYKGRISEQRSIKYANDALNQIETKLYYQELEKHKIKNILLYALVFDDANVKVLSKEKS